MAHWSRMRMIVYQGIVTSEVVIGSIDTKVGIGDGGMRYDNAVKNLLKEGGRAMVRVDVVNGEGLDGGGKKSKTHCIFNPKSQQVT